MMQRRQQQFYNSIELEKRQQEAYAHGLAMATRATGNPADGSSNAFNGHQRHQQIVDKWNDVVRVHSSANEKVAGGPPVLAMGHNPYPPNALQQQKQQHPAMFASPADLELAYKMDAKQREAANLVNAETQATDIMRHMESMGRGGFAHPDAVRTHPYNGRIAGGMPMPVAAHPAFAQPPENF